MCNRSFGFAIAVAYLPLIVVTFIGGAGGREIRPSEHGLEYQDGPPAGKKSPEMMTFFKGTSSSSAPEVALPRAMNSSDPSWWGGSSGEGRGKGRDHVKEVLLVASLVCGITGVAFLVAAAFLLFHRFRRQRSSEK